jgi:Ala-tRNA(Pro) deacylase
MAKTVVLKGDDKHLLFVLPAVMKIDMKALRNELPFKHLELATEKEFAALFPDSEVGAMAPFGNLYQLDTYVDKSLVMDDEIVFNAGTHIDTIRMKYRDYERLIRPQVVQASIRLEMADGV